jgi:hypothetical protein
MLAFVALSSDPPPLPDPALASLAAATLGHLWWTLHLAQALATQAALGGPIPPGLQSALADLQSALDTTAALRQDILRTLQTKVETPLFPLALWD